MDEERLRVVLTGDQIRDTVDRSYQKVRELIDDLERENEELTERLRTFSETEEIRKRDEKIDDLYHRSLLLMSEKELCAERAFRTRHYALHNGGKFKTVGNTYIYTISGTGLGPTIKIKCPICGEEEDITDFESW